LVALAVPSSQSALAQTCDATCGGGPSCDCNCTPTPCPGPTCDPICVTQPGYSGGSGTANDPYKIGKPLDLVHLSKHSTDWNKYFCQIQDIDMAATPCQPITPIGTQAIPFTGCYSGNRYKIRNLEVVSVDLSTADATGMFGVVGRDGTAQVAGTVVDVFLENPTVIGSTTDVGSLIGRLVYGCVYCCGAMSGRAFNGADLHYTSTGGLIGQMCPATLVWKSFSTTLVSGADFVGGLVGQNAGQIEYCYAENKVIQSGNWPPAMIVEPYVCLGGLVGFNNGGSIRGSYAYSLWLYSYEPIPNGRSVFKGGLVGLWVPPNGIPFFPAPYNFSRHCTPGLNQSVPNNSIGFPNQASTPWANGVAKSKNDSDMLKRATYEGWDFEDIWFIVDGTDTPRLRCF